MNRSTQPHPPVSGHPFTPVHALALALLGSATGFLPSPVAAAYTRKMGTSHIFPGSGG
jgi:hypothetical protein